VLSPPIDSAAPTTASPAGDPMVQKQRLEVRRVLVPDYLDDTDIQMRTGSDEVQSSVTGRWGERLSLGVTRALSADLAARMPRYTIVQDGATNPQRQLRISVTALDLWPNGHCVLAANWSIVDQDSTTPVTSGSATFVDSLNAGGPATATDASRVEAIARTLAKLADNIVQSAEDGTARGVAPN